MNTLIEIKNQYAQEQGYEDWNDIRKEFREKLITFTEMTGHENEICIRAQKAALENAAENALLNVCDNKIITIYRPSITNEENLIR